MSREGDVARLLSEIQACEEEKIATMQQYAGKLQELKCALAETCGHSIVRHSWAWAICADCGFTELIAWPGFANSREAGQQTEVSKR